MPEPRFQLIEFANDPFRAKPQLDHVRQGPAERHTDDPLDVEFKKVEPNATLGNAWLAEEKFATDYLGHCDHQLKLQGIQPVGAVYLRIAQFGLLVARLANEPANVGIATCAELARRGWPSQASLQRVLERFFDTLWHLDEHYFMNLGFKSKAIEMCFETRYPAKYYPLVVDLAQQIRRHAPGRQVDAQALAKREADAAVDRLFGIF